MYSLRILTRTINQKYLAHSTDINKLKKDIQIQNMRSVSDTCKALEKQTDLPLAESLVRFTPVLYPINNKGVPISVTEIERLLS